jgi:hypothetical protein
MQARCALQGMGMKRQGVRFSVALIVFVMLGMVPVAAPSGVAAQAANSQVLLGNVAVAWNAPWAKDTEASGAGQGWEQLWLDGSLGSVLVETDVPAVPAQQLREELLGAIGADTPVERVLETGSGTYTSTVDIARYPDSPVGILIDVYEEPTGTRLFLLVAGVSVFAEVKASVEASITIGGQPLFANIDGVIVQTNLEAADGQPSGTTVQAPVATGGTTGQVPPSGTTAQAPATGSTGTAIPPQPAAGGPVVIADVNDSVPQTGPITLVGTGSVVQWSDAWSVVSLEDDTVRLWNAQARVGAEVWTRQMPIPPPSAADLARSDLVTSSGWTVQSAVDLVPGSRFALAMTLSNGSDTRHQFSEIAVIGDHIQVVNITGWDGAVAAALPVFQASVTVDGQPPLMSTSLPAGMPPAQPVDPNSHKLLISGQVVSWTDQWVTVKLHASGVRLLDAGETMVARVWSGTVEPIAAAEQAEQILASPAWAERGLTVYKATDIEPGVRALVVMQEQTVAGTRYHVFDTRYFSIGQQSIQHNRYMTGTTADFAAQHAFVQANVTVDGGIVFDDLQTLVPELFGGTAASTGLPAVATGQQGPPAAPVVAQGGSHTVPLDGTALTWTAGWAVDPAYVSDNSVKLVNSANPRLSLVYVQATALRSVTDAESWIAFETATYPNTTVISAIDLPDSPMPRWIGISEVPADNTIVVSDCRVTDVAPICLTGTFPKEDVAGGVALMQAEVTINGGAPFQGMEDGLSLIYMQ